MIGSVLRAAFLGSATVQASEGPTPCGTDYLTPQQAAANAFSSVLNKTSCKRTAAAAAGNAAGNRALSSGIGYMAAAKVAATTCKQYGCVPADIRRTARAVATKGVKAKGGCKKQVLVAAKKAEAQSQTPTQAGAAAYEACRAKHGKQAACIRAAGAAAGKVALALGNRPTKAASMAANASLALGGKKKDLQKIAYKVVLKGIKAKGVCTKDAKKLAKKASVRQLHLFKGVPCGGNVSFENPDQAGKLAFDAVIKEGGKKASACTAAGRAATKSALFLFRTPRSAAVNVAHVVQGLGCSPHLVRKVATQAAKTAVKHLGGTPMSAIKAGAKVVSSLNHAVPCGVAAGSVNQSVKQTAKSVLSAVIRAGGSKRQAAKAAGRAVGRAMLQPAGARGRGWWSTFGANVSKKVGKKAMKVAYKKAASICRKFGGSKKDASKVAHDVVVHHMSSLGLCSSMVNAAANKAAAKTMTCKKHKAVRKALANRSGANLSVKSVKSIKAKAKKAAKTIHDKIVKKGGSRNLACRAAGRVAAHAAMKISKSVTHALKFATKMLQHNGCRNRDIKKVVHDVTKGSSILPGKSRAQVKAAGCRAKAKTAAKACFECPSTAAKRADRMVTQRGGTKKQACTAAGAAAGSAAISAGKSPHNAALIAGRLAKQYGCGGSAIGHIAMKTAKKGVVLNGGSAAVAKKAGKKAAKHAMKSCKSKSGMKTSAVVKKVWQAVAKNGGTRKEAATAAAKVVAKSVLSTKKCPKKAAKAVAKFCKKHGCGHKGLKKVLKKVMSGDIGGKKMAGGRLNYNRDIMKAAQITAEMHRCGMAPIIPGMAPQANNSNGTNGTLSFRKTKKNKNKCPFAPPDIRTDAPKKHAMMSVCKRAMALTQGNFSKRAAAVSAGKAVAKAALAIGKCPEEALVHASACSKKFGAHRQDLTKLSYHVASAAAKAKGATNEEAHAAGQKAAVAIGATKK